MYNVAWGWTTSVHSAVMIGTDELPGGGPASDDYSGHLLAAIVAAVPGWVSRTIGTRVDRQSGPDERDVEASIDVASREMVAGVHGALERLFAEDVEAQRVNPLQILRDQASCVTRELTKLGARPAQRDEFDRVSQPDDVYGIGPVTWRDLGEAVHDAGITWGAWKAATVMMRHRENGPRT